MASGAQNAQINWDTLWFNANIVSCAKESIQRCDALAVKADKIVWMGELTSLNPEQRQQVKQSIDVQRKCITPGLIDCHTHVVYEGNRAFEFAQRLQGKTYAEIAAAGGGINASVRATRAASSEELLYAAKKTCPSTDA